MSTPRVVHASRARRVRVHTPGRTLPVIVVPDLLGTRLADPDSGDLVWNPYGAPFGPDPHGHTIDVERLGQMSAELAPAEESRYPRISQNRAGVQSKVEHGFGMVSGTYAALCQSLVDDDGPRGPFQSTGVVRKVYFCGYDWRQDCARSALRLAEMVDEALEATGERKVVLIGHGMGGQIARYYCRALGGEPKVHQTFLIGTPILGTPAAYAALKHGIEGMYVREITDAIRGERTGALVFECVAQLADVITAIGSHSAGGVLGSLFGDIYLMLCVDAGKWLSREETRNLVRQMPSVYQLLPGAIHCRDNLHWVIFDPLATGVAPTGYMVPMPTVASLHLDAIMAMIAGGNASTLAALQSAVRDFMEGPSEGVPSARASRNAMPFVQMIARAIAYQARWGTAIGQINWSASDLGAEFTRFGDLGRAMRDETELLVAAFKAFGEQAGRTFIDCRNPRRLYEDIYTGLLDSVEERPLVSASLPLSYRFDETLTVTPKEEKPVSLLDALMMAVNPLLSGLVAGLRAMWFGLGALPRGSGAGAAYDQRQRQHSERAAAERADDQAIADRRARSRVHAKAYLPPNSYAVYSGGDLMPGGALIQPLAFVSHDDANLVRTAYVPDLVASGHLRNLSGDGFVPLSSAAPLDTQLARPFEGGRSAGTQAVPRVRHSALPAAAQTTQFIETKLVDKLHDFLRGGTGG